MKTKIAFLLFVICISSGFAQVHQAECNILKDENSIVCKYSTPIVTKEELITVQWLSPKNEIERQRDITVYPNGVSVYDFRFLDGRDKGTWHFTIIKNGEKVAETTFTVD
ncbi:MAG: hypothetical protein RBR23_02955 [Arcobacteraceae bacterium]|jgi:hypothetical protein|nr:hypothetical protein [Arcobacteraceae bacterium]